MFRQAAMMMSPAKTTSAALARNSPTPTKVAASAALRALYSPSSATKRMASTSPSAKKNAAVGTMASPKKLTFDAQAAAKTKAVMRNVAATGASPKQKAAAAWKQTVAALAKTSATESAVSSALRSVCSPQKSASKKALSSPKKKKTTARCSPKSAAVVSPQGASKTKEMAKKAAEFMGDDLTEVDFDAAASIMDTLKTEVLHPVDPVAVNLFGGATPATATAHALMVAPTQETSLSLALGVEALLHEMAAAATSIDDVVLEIPFAVSGSESAVATEALELAAQEIAPEGIVQAPAAAVPILPNTTATTRGANATSFALYDSIMNIVGDIIPVENSAAAAVPAATLGSEYPQHVIENRCIFQSPVHHMPMKL